MQTEHRHPLSICWHCDRPLDAATAVEGDESIKPERGSITLCLYCGALSYFGEDMRLMPPTEVLLDALEEDRDFMMTYLKFAWGRQYVMLNANLMRDGNDPDR